MVSVVVSMSDPIRTTRTRIYIEISHTPTYRLLSATVKNPLVSIGMPVYNCGDTVAEAIISIVDQTFKDWELIVIDDGSTDRTLEVVRRFADPRIRIVSGGSNRYLPARLNEAVHMAKGKYFARMDGDDVSYHDRLEKQVSHLLKHPEIDLLGGSIVIFGKDGRAVGLRRAKETHEEICGPPWRPSVLAHITWMGKHAWFLRNPYREEFFRTEDRDLLTRTRRESHFAALPDILAGQREAGLSLKKQIPARRQFLRTLAREGIRQKSPSLLIPGIPVELTKFALDIIAIKTGLTYKILKYRLPAVSESVAEQWWSIWQETRNLAAPYYHELA
jgi:glycosyltransferase involved in cell wall biosynthesis